MTPDYHTPCPCCPKQVRVVVISGELALDKVRAAFRSLSVEARNSDPVQEAIAACASFRAGLRELRPFYEAHEANQVHNSSPELVEERDPVLVLPPLEPVLPL